MITFIVVTLSFIYVIFPGKRSEEATPFGEEKSRKVAGETAGNSIRAKK